MRPPLRSISAWLDDRAPQQGAFAHALEWASRLRLSLKGFAGLADAAGNGNSNGCVTQQQLEACEAACIERGIAWEAHVWEQPTLEAVEPLLRTVDCCVFCRILPMDLQEGLLRLVWRAPQAAVLICAPTRPVASRALIINRGRGNRQGFLEAVIQLHEALPAPPVVLTVAGSVREAQDAQQLAEETFAGHRRAADFDFMVDSDLGDAIRREARLRHCSHVIVEKDETASWSSWWHQDRFERLLRLADALTVLAQPCLVRAETVLPAVGNCQTARI